MGLYTIPTIYRNVGEDLRSMGHADWAAQEDTMNTANRFQHRYHTSNDYFSIICQHYRDFYMVIAD